MDYFNKAKSWGGCSSPLSTTLATPLGTIQGQVQLLSQHFLTPMCTLLLVDSARTNTKSESDCDELT